MTLPESKSLDIREVAKMLGLKPQYGTGARGNWWCFCQQDGRRHDSPDLAFYNGSKFYCFRCGKNGDTADLVRESLNLTLPEALKWLADPDRKIPIIDVKAVEERRSNEKPSHYYAEVYEAFYGRCIRIDDRRAIEATRYWFEEHRKLSLDTAIYFGLRLIRRAYRDVMVELEEEFGGEMVQASGLSAFFPYYKSDTVMLIVPYFPNNNEAPMPHYLKARPLLARVPEGVKRFANVRGYIPFPYNAPFTIGSSCPIIIVEGESDVWMLHDAGFDGSDCTLPLPVGIPGARVFKPEWLCWFKDASGRGRKVYQFIDTDKPDKYGNKAGEALAQKTAQAFRDGGLEPPVVVSVPNGKDVSEWLKQFSREERKGLVMEAIRE